MYVYIIIGYVIKYLITETNLTLTLKTYLFLAINMYNVRPDNTSIFSIIKPYGQPLNP